MNNILFKRFFLVSVIFVPIIILTIAKLFFNNFFTTSFYIQYSYLNIILIILISPILEEIVFRGLLQDLFLKYIHNKVIAFIILNIIFTFMHYKFGLNTINLIYFIFLFICGMIFSVTKNIFYKLSYVIYLHCYYNIIFLLFLRC